MFLFEDQAEGKRRGSQVLPEDGDVPGAAELGAEAVRSGQRPPGRERVRLGSQSCVRVSPSSSWRGQVHLRRTEPQSLLLSRQHVEHVGLLKARLKACSLFCPVSLSLTLSLALRKRSSSWKVSACFFVFRLQLTSLLMTLMSRQQGGQVLAVQTSTCVIVSSLRLLSLPVATLTLVFPCRAALAGGHVRAVAPETEGGFPLQRRLLQLFQANV